RTSRRPRACAAAGRRARTGSGPATGPRAPPRRRRDARGGSGRRCRPSARGSAAGCPGLRLPLQLDRADADRVARLDPGPPELGVGTRALEVALEPLRGFLDLEVRLSGEALDPPA